MRRRILAAFVVAAAFTIGFGAAATAAVDVDAQAAAKKKAGKKKACKPKKGKKSGKRASGCKPKGKKKGKATPPKQGQPPRTGATLGEGVYRDVGQRLTIRVVDGGSQATIGFPGGRCVSNAMTYVTGPIAQQGSEARGSGTQTILGGDGSVKWSLSVSPNLGYSLDAVTSTDIPGLGPCETSKNVSGKLEKL